MGQVTGTTQTPNPQRTIPVTEGAPAATPVSEAAGLGTDNFEPTQAQSGPRIMEKLGEFSDKLIYKNYSGRIVKYDPVPWAHLGLEMGARPITPDDSLLTADPYRMRTIQRMQAAGQTATWAEVRGAIHPNVSGGIGAPVGPVSIGAGAWVDAQIGLSVLSPFPHSLKAPIKAGQDLTLDFPFSARKAAALVEGAEAIMRGQGSIGASASVSAGQEYQLGAGFSAGVSAGVSAAKSKSLDLALRVKRLDGQKVLVSLTRVDADNTGTSVSLNAGLKTPLQEKLEANKVPSLGAKLIDSQIERWLRLEVGTHYSTTEADKEVSAYVLDLADPASAEAYERMLRLDLDPAEALAAKAGSGVRRAHLSETTVTKGSGVDASLGPIRLLRTAQSTAHSEGKLEDAKGTMTYQVGTVDKLHEDVITRWFDGRDHTTREYIETNREMVGNMYRLRSEVEVDGSTSKDAVRRFMTASGYLVGEERVKAAMAADPELLTRFWRSRRVMDVTIQRDGLKKVLEATPAQLHTAYAAAYEELDRPWDTTRLFGMGAEPWRVTPWLNTTDPKFPEVMALLAKGPEHSVDQHGGERQQNTRDQQYYWITGRNLYQDHAAFKESKALVNLLSSIKQAKTGSERADILIKAEGSLKLDPLRELGMLSKIAGRENLAIRELALRDRSDGKDVVFENFGLTGDPREQVEQGLAMGGRQAL